VLVDELEVVLGADHRTGVAGEGDDRQLAEDGVDRAPLQSQLTYVRAGEQRAGRLEQPRRRRSTGRLPTFVGRLAAAATWRLLDRRLLELQLAWLDLCYPASVAYLSTMLSQHQRPRMAS
jgi:hypothetical protein